MSASQPHPLEPLTADEIAMVVRLVQEDDRATACRFVSVMLNDAPKESVLAGEGAAREVEVVMLDSATRACIAAIVSLSAGLKGCSRRSWATSSSSARRR